jgi:hypothetical protein
MANIEFWAAFRVNGLACALGGLLTCLGLMYLGSGTGVVLTLAGFLILSPATFIGYRRARRLTRH